MNPHSQPVNPGPTQGLYENPDPTYNKQVCGSGSDFRKENESGSDSDPT